MNPYTRGPNAMSERERFLSHIYKSDSGSWLWTASTISGYGNFTADGTTVAAHRYSWVFHHGGIPEGLWVLHKCDVKRCVNPDHLYLGTHKDNTEDAVRRGRVATGDRHRSKTSPETLPRGDANGMRKHPESVQRGELNKTARLTNEQVVEIRRLCGLKVRQRDIAAKFNVSQRTVWRVFHRKAWAHV